ncbi:hypothetical protein V8C35DRAFT_210062 [Trichoderma chlorosporum]
MWHWTWIVRDQTEGSPSPPAETAVTSDRTSPWLNQGTQGAGPACSLKASLFLESELEKATCRGCYRHEASVCLLLLVRSLAYAGRRGSKQKACRQLVYSRMKASVFHVLVAAAWVQVLRRRDPPPMMVVMAFTLLPSSARRRAHSRSAHNRPLSVSHPVSFYSPGVKALWPNRGATHGQCADTRRASNLPPLGCKKCRPAAASPRLG